MSSKLAGLLARYDSATAAMQTALLPFLLLGLRLSVAWVFFRSGLSKIANWDSTLYLFELEYQVPLIHWQLAAYLATAGELLLPVLLAVGLLTRVVASALFVINAVAVLSYPLLWEQGFYDHQLWGLMILVLMIWGAGPFSADQLVRRTLTH
ncbi:hypothetical protein BOO91_18610 [Vibrio navarrensis]|uniref:DoxX family protein n=1 Tax=Vibrio navarrensis TaxID=29495 RepID=A0AAJ4IB93_9VIBR|nr:MULTISPECIES: DoxX family protein [Vibrio]KJR37580.1 membrane protein [Vibrio sp. S234-5]MBE3654644.1 hypothetical protein [Vibrio navarrensis]MBE3658563.1 hypothetical protein [Vibrio navarrensis]MBE3662947.1 hypothetical protein [Vibrio navarrensis]MBE4605557.1 hypothetical protein [Vibrio navarrensis]